MDWVWIVWYPFGGCCLCPSVGLDYLILGYLSPGCGRGLFPLLPGCRPVYLAGLLGGMFVGFGCLSYARCVGLLVNVFVSGRCPFIGVVMSVFRFLWEPASCMIVCGVLPFWK